MISKLNNNPALSLLKNNKTGHLGCILDTGEPNVVPVNYIIIENDIYIHSAPGQKIAAMQSNPKICLQTEKVTENGLQWQSVIVFGQYEEITDEEAKAEILLGFSEKFPRLTPVEAALGSRGDDQGIVVFRLKIERLSAVEEGH
ncbi:MAG: pyridoxamine 5'-phosphate oxidase family protein [Acidobacteria bacterium]|nr:pyridoxamine 5'-phosphate oxidase family protein [Acidobacteriota bacterium]